MRAIVFVVVVALSVSACSWSSVQGTEPPPDGWANRAPTSVEQVIDRGDTQLLAVKQGALQTWIEVPAVGAKVGDYVLLGQGSARTDVEIPELGARVPAVVDIAHVQVVDRATAEATLAASAPAGAVSIGTLYAELAQRAGTQVVVHGTVVKASNAVGHNWVHLQDGTGDAASGTNDLTVKTQASVRTGQRVAFRGVLRQDVDLGFGYHYDALVEEGVLVDAP